VTCHGGVTTPPVTAPTSGLTCFNCHHPDGPAHSSDWGGKSSAQPIPPHGAAAILAAGAPFNLASPVFPDPLSGLTGMASCVPCHGPLYNGTDLTGTIPNNTAAGGAPSCYACHTTAPHPPAPWGAGLGLPATQPNHDQVDPSNASECVKCHALGANTNPAITPVVPAPAGTAPGCFNGTLCHSKSLS